MEQVLLEQLSMGEKEPETIEAVVAQETNADNTEQTTDFADADPTYEIFPFSDEYDAEAVKPQEEVKEEETFLKYESAPDLYIGLDPDERVFIFWQACIAGLPKSLWFMYNG
ncbi:MAG TPA: hypothetical protein VJH97_00575 [Candidatus Nanoarchaeia archaeon]|nr:hypothetical protein [Candidatus Nanoarchaeia archaeon]